jgi:hypothetical protein
MRRRLNTWVWAMQWTRVVAGALVP